MMKDKNVIRKSILTKRNNLDKNVSLSLSEIITKKFISLNEYKSSKSILSYMSFKNEVDTLELINKMLEDGKRVIIPYTNVDKIEIIPVEIKSMDKDLEYSKYGYLEPIKEKVKPVNIDEIDIIIVPGVVFDRKLNRIGFGKGYYDRLLCNKRKNANSIAFAYDFQVLNNIPYNEHDVKMDKIITEKEVII